MIEQNYNYLCIVGTRITGNADLGKDLLTETYLVLTDKKVDFPTDDMGFIKFFSKCMSNFFRWPNSSFNQNFKIPDRLTIKEQEETETEEPNDDTLIDEVTDFKGNLPPHQKVLFELYFEKGMSARRIAELLEIQTGFSIHEKSMQKLIKPIKTNLKQTKWKSSSLSQYSR